LAKGKNTKGLNGEFKRALALTLNPDGARGGNSKRMTRIIMPRLIEHSHEYRFVPHRLLICNDFQPI
jgi:hypothetical protein